MNTLVNETQVEPIGVEVTSDALTIELSDGRTVSAPTEWFPRLAHGTPSERLNFELMPSGVHWPELNEDISVQSLLRGEKSGESTASIGRWLDYRSRGLMEPIKELPLDPRLAAELAKVESPSKKTRNTKKTKPSKAFRR